jgi:hypothetical protein
MFKKKAKEWLAGLLRLQFGYDPIHTIQHKLKQSNAIRNRSKRLKEYLVRGYAFNQKRLDELQQTIRLMQWDRVRFLFLIS